MNEIITLLETAEHQVLNLSVPSDQVRVQEEIYQNINEALSIIRVQSSFLSLFFPMCFNSLGELIEKANEIDVKPYDGATIITYFIHVIGKLCRTTNTRLFYLKAPHTQETYESLLDHNFKVAFGWKNVFLSSNSLYGSLLIVETKEEDELCQKYWYSSLL